MDEEDRGQVLQESTEYRTEGGLGFGDVQAGGKKNKYTMRLYEDGTVWISKNDGPETFAGIHEEYGPQLATAWRAKQSAAGKVKESEWAPVGGTSGETITERNKVTGEYRTVPNPGYAADDPETMQVEHEDGSKWLHNKNDGKPIYQMTGPTNKAGSPDIFWVGRDAYMWDASQNRAVPAPGVPQKPLESSNPLDDQYKRLQIQKAQQDLIGSYEKAVQEREQAIAYIEGEMRAGRMTNQQGNQYMQAVDAHSKAALQGTTPYAMEKDKAGLAQDVLSDQMGTGASMATGLMNGLGGIYSKILSSTNPPLGFDPLAMAKGFVQDLGGGPQINEQARAVLHGALGGGQGQSLPTNGNYLPPPRQMPSANNPPKPSDYSALGMQKATAGMSQLGPGQGTQMATGLMQGAATGAAGAEQYRPIVARYFPPEAVDNILRIMEMESGGNPGASNTNGEDSWGLLQVNRVAHPQWAIDQLKDPETNIRAASEIFKAGGYAPWLNASRALGLLPLGGAG